MKILLGILILLFTVSSCNMLKKRSSDDKKTKSEENKKEIDKENQKEKSEDMQLKFNQPVLIDSSVYVMYPLMLEDNDEERGIVSKSYGSQIVYWNIVFYNTENGEYHLLDSNRRMAIHSYAQGNIRSTSGSTTFNAPGYSQADKLIYYWVTTTDYNRDEKINLVDPKYLFISDKEGKNFKQISPDNFNVVNWQVINGTNKILIQAVKDVNNDKKFDKEDEAVPFVYDITSGDDPKEIFSSEFKSKMEKLLEKQWKEK